MKPVFILFLHWTSTLWQFCSRWCTFNLSRRIGLQKYTPSSVTLSNTRKDFKTATKILSEIAATGFERDSARPVRVSFEESFLLCFAQTLVSKRVGGRIALLPSHIHAFWWQIFKPRACYFRSSLRSLVLLHRCVLWRETESKLCFHSQTTSVSTLAREWTSTWRIKIGLSDLCTLLCCQPII